MLRSGSSPSHHCLLLSLCSELLLILLHKQLLVLLLLEIQVLLWIVPTIYSAVQSRVGRLHLTTLEVLMSTRKLVDRLLWVIASGSPHLVETWLRLLHLRLLHVRVHTWILKAWLLLNQTWMAGKVLLRLLPVVIVACCRVRIELCCRRRDVRRLGMSYMLMAWLMLMSRLRLLRIWNIVRVKVPLRSLERRLLFNRILIRIYWSLILWLLHQVVPALVKLLVASTNIWLWSWGTHLTIIQEGVAGKYTDLTQLKRVILNPIGKKIFIDLGFRYICCRSWGAAEKGLPPNWLGIPGC